MDINAAFVLVALIGSICIITTSLIVKRRSGRIISNEFELAKMKQRDEQARDMYVRETNRAVEFKKLEQNLITSHARVGE